MFISRLKRCLFRLNPPIRFQSTISVSPNLLDLRVGQISDIQFHPDADKLYVSQISLKDTSIQVCSGLVGIVPQSQLLNSKVVVVCNLKPSKMRGVQSQGMILCVERNVGGENYNVEPILPPSEAEPGVSLEFSNAVPIDVKKRIKGKQWDAIAPGLKSNSNGEVIWEATDGTQSILNAIFDGQKQPVLVPSGFESCSIR